MKKHRTDTLRFPEQHFLIRVRVIGVNLSEGKAKLVGVPSSSQRGSTVRCFVVTAGVLILNLDNSNLSLTRTFSPDYRLSGYNQYITVKLEMYVAAMYYVLIKLVMYVIVK